MTRVIGLISGTSVDGIDAALVEVTGVDVDLKVQLLAGETYPYPADLREQILAVCAGAPLSMAEFAELDDAIALAFAQAALEIQTGYPPAQLIGSHGQNVYHRPPNNFGSPILDFGLRAAGQESEFSKTDQLFQNPLGPSKMGYSLQLGRGAMIAQLTGIPTVSNFRSADIAAGGQGAPLVPGVDAYLLSHPTQYRCVQNIGGIGNVTYLPAHQKSGADGVLGWDTGPGNALLDLAVQHFTDNQQTYDKDGAWAATGTPCISLVNQWLQQEFFHKQPPKSTGRELFSPLYLRQCILDSEVYALSPADILATLTELTVASIVHSYRTFLPHQPDEVLLCGGGSQNLYLKHRLQVAIEPISVSTTDEAGVDASFKEAIAFAVLAYWKQLGFPGNVPQVTGALSKVQLGDFHIPIL